MRDANSMVGVGTKRERMVYAGATASFQGRRKSVFRLLQIHGEDVDMVPIEQSEAS